MKNILMIKISDENSLWITNYDIMKEELTFRTTYNPRIQTEKVFIGGNKVYTNLYHFDIVYLQKFLESKNGNI